MGCHKHTFTTYQSIASCIYTKLVIDVCKLIHANISEHEVYKKSNLKKRLLRIKNFIIYEGYYTILNDSRNLVVKFPFLKSSFFINCK